jgi:hypothetical protein
MPNDDVPRFVADHDAALEVGTGIRLLRFTAGGYGVEHRCDRGDRGIVDHAPRIDNHNVTGDWPDITVTPSILCVDCSLHGFIRNGHWSPA